MQTAQQIAQEALDYICARVNVTTGTRDDFKRFLTGKILPLTPAQSSLNFADQQALKGQSDAILKLLKERRSSGATNAELNSMCINHTGRISDLREAGWKITATRQGGSRTWLYQLSPTDW